MESRIKFIVSLFLFIAVSSHVNGQEIPDSADIMESVEMETSSPEPTVGSEDGGMYYGGEEEEVVAAEDLADTSIMIVDGFMNLKKYKDAKPIPLPTVNPNNVKFYKRIWREIDLRDSANSHLFFLADGTSFTELIVNAVKQGRIIAYDPRPTKKDPTGDGFKARFAPTEAMARLVDSVLVPQFDSLGNQIGANMVLNEFNPENITKYRIKEDIFFDKQRARFETRIIGLAPLKKITAGGEELSEVAFWLYFPHIRKVLVTKQCKNEMTYDDLFIQHNFVSEITRDSRMPNKRVENPAMVEKQIEQFKESTWKY